MTEAVTLEAEAPDILGVLEPVTRRRRGRPRGDGLVPAEIRAALDGRLGDRLQRLARVLQAMDINVGGTLPRRCDVCGAPVRYSLKDYGVLNLYCTACLRSTNRALGPLPRDPAPRTCPECGGPNVAHDPGRGEWFCRSCWATFSPDA